MTMEIITEISPERTTELIDKISRFIVERKMAAAAIMFIESLKPLSFIGSQAMYFLAPFAELIFDSKEYQEFAVLLEKRENVDLVVKRIDELDTELYEEIRKKNRLIRKRRMNKFKEFVKKIFKSKK